MESLISIIMPVYNRAFLIEETLESVTCQTYGHWEMIIVDDGSTDGTINLLKRYEKEDGRIRIHQRDRQPKGASTCRNIGLAMASGELIIYLDSDDLLAPDCLERRVRLFNDNPTMDFLVFPTRLFRSAVNDSKLLWNIDSQEDDLIRFLRIDALWQTTGPIYKRESLIRIGGFNEELPFWQDFDLHLRCLLKRFAYKKFLHEKPDSFHRMNYVDSISRTIPFTKDLDILEIRTNFYFRLGEFSEREKVFLHKEHRTTIWSVLFFFASRYWLDHRRWDLFFTKLFKAKRIGGAGTIEYCLAVCYFLLIQLAKRLRLFVLIHRAYRRIFMRYLPDNKIFSRNTMAKTEIAE